MKAPAFHYLKPASLEQCLVALSEYGDDAQVLAGGQSLMPLLNLRLAAAAVLVDIAGIDELRGIRQQNGSIVIGALETHNAISQSATIKQNLPLLAQAGPHIAHVAVRSRGTIGGSLALADPAAEWPACCLALDARIELASSAGRRLVAANDFFHGVYSTDRRADEVLTEIHFPIAGTERLHHFDEVSRRRGDFAIAGVAIACHRRGDRLDDVRIAMLGVADRPILTPGTMAALDGYDLDADRIATAADRLSTELDPPEDPAYPADYRRRVAVALLKRALSSVQGRQHHAQ